LTYTYNFDVKFAYSLPHGGVDYHDLQY